MLFLKARSLMPSKNGGSERSFFGMWKHLEGKMYFSCRYSLPGLDSVYIVLHSSGSVVIGTLWPGRKE